MSKHLSHGCRGPAAPADIKRGPSLSDILTIGDTNMPLYSYECNKCEGTIEVLDKYENILDELECHETEGCDGMLIRQVGMSSKPLVMDRDLISARTHSGKK
ncbi:hypothetical protein UFOVP1437_17 [uncultured Caudovirales phage]|uniref:Uncharacterized protein n=1 Tax=uncultured Caudovirales phage TaxID=2100421 RepID=A0A6J7XBB1_9CAUD|nr:hypothetical protein UFOVP1437_17 [uncultured Caudovirales phage]CAB5228153.1 hypothetical protein UFOVP1531_47 [uncultured Caudovirales phage]